MEKYDIIFIDGNHLGYRNFYANGNLKTKFSNGVEIGTGVAFGFFQSLVYIKEKYLKENQLYIVWDWGSRLRKTISPEYKANRIQEKVKPEELYLTYPKQRNLTQKLLKYAGIPQIQAQHWEADDVLYSCTKIFNKLKIGIYTGDHDLFQVIKENIHIIRPSKNRDSEIIYTREYFFKEKGIYPEQWLDVMSIMGCSGDNVAGIKGIGEKTAIKIIQGKPISTKFQEKYEKAQQDGTIKKTRELVKLYDVAKFGKQINIDFYEPDYNKLKGIFKLLNFKHFLKKFEFIKKLAKTK